MTPTIEEVNKAAIKCGATNSILLDPIATLQLGKYLAFDPAQLQAFAQHYIEVGRKMQRESDVKVCMEIYALPYSTSDGFRRDRSAAGDCAEAIRNNTGE